MDQVAGGGATQGSGAGVYGFPESEGPARRLAQALSLPCRVAVIHRFPDGERLVRLAHVFDHAILYRSLNDPALKDPDDKLVELLFAASALRDHGTRRLTLVAPYLSYMRQDIAFHPGEAVSQKVMGRLLGDAFDRVFTVDPHLHRTGTLAQVLPGAEAQALSAAPALARLLGDDPPPPDALLVGPDTESRALVSGVAEPLGLDWAVGDKLRRGDRAVTIRLPEALRLHGRPVILVDDAVSTGANGGRRERRGRGRPRPLPAGARGRVPQGRDQPPAQHRQPDSSQQRGPARPSLRRGPRLGAALAWASLRGEGAQRAWSPRRRGRLQAGPRAPI
jgi:ribose-phosphate pyrophosphokinase